MNNRPVTRMLMSTTACLAIAILFPSVPAQAASDEARVTRIIKDVKVLPAEAKPKPAVLNEKIGDGTGVRTGDQSRSELTFTDRTIERLGANTVFSFNRGGRSVRLNNGSMLLRVPKDSGGADMSTNAVTVGITGTTVILETRNGRNKLIALEGGARVSLNKHKGESVYVRGGQMEDVPAGANKLPPPVNINLSDLMRKNPLITDFPPLPSQDLIMATASNPPASTGQPVNGEPVGPGPVSGQPPIIPIITGMGLGPFFGGSSGGGGGHPNTGPTRGHTKDTGRYPNNAKGSSNGGSNQQEQQSGSKTHASRAVASPTPTPSRKSKDKKNSGNG
jgi:FecR protein